MSRELPNCEQGCLATESNSNANMSNSGKIVRSMCSSVINTCIYLMKIVGCGLIKVLLILYSKNLIAKIMNFCHKRRCSG